MQDFVYDRIIYNTRKIKNNDTGHKNNNGNKGKGWAIHDEKAKRIKMKYRFLTIKVITIAIFFLNWEVNWFLEVFKESEVLFQKSMVKE